MRSHVFWILIIPFAIFAVIIWSYTPPSERRLAEFAKQAQNQAERHLRSITLQVSQPRLTISSTPANDERKIRFFESQKEEQEHLKKLITRNPKNLDYKYRLAMSFKRQEEGRKATEIMKSIAPEHKPGHPGAHLYMAHCYLRMPVKNNSGPRQEKQALTHLNHYLTGDEDNIEAQKLKAELLVRRRRFAEAYVIYDKLFVDDPVHYGALISINNEQNNTEANSTILDDARRRLRKRVKEGSDDVDIWVTSWQHYVMCLIELKEFVTAEADLLKAIKDNETEIANRKFMEKLLANVYASQAAAIGRVAKVVEQQQQLGLLRNASKYDSQNPKALKWLTTLGLSSHPGVRAQAIVIYDPLIDPRPPNDVLHVLGDHALQIEDHERASRIFASIGPVAKETRDPILLYILASSYLKQERANPERALLLVEQALTYVLSIDLAERSTYQSKFFHTRGTALRQLRRNADAIDMFKIALEEQPDNEEILKSLIQIYLDQPGDQKEVEALKSRLQKIRSAQIEGS